MTAVLLVLVLLGLTALSLWGIVDATIQPEQAYRSVGIGKGTTSVVMILTCTLGSIWYFAYLRPRLVRAQR